MGKIWCLSTLLMIVSCGSDEGGTRPATPDPDEGQSFTEPVEAATGGTLTTSSGRFRLDIPAGALSADTSLRVEVLPRADETLGSIYSLSPDGLSFAQPATLRIAFDGTRGARERPMLATDEGSGWQTLSDSRWVDGDMIATIDGFSSKAIIETVATLCGDGIEEDSGDGDSGANCRFTCTVPSSDTDPCECEGTCNGTITVGGSCVGQDCTCTHEGQSVPCESPIVEGTTEPIHGDALRSCLETDETGSGPEPAGRDTMCQVDDLDCEDGKSRDFDCTAESCVCKINDVPVSSHPYAGQCSGKETEAEVWEIANAVCGWSVMPSLQTLDQHDDGSGDGDGS